MDKILETLSTRNIKSIGNSARGRGANARLEEMGKYQVLNELKRSGLSFS